MQKKATKIHQLKIKEKLINLLCNAHIDIALSQIITKSAVFALGQHGSQTRVNRFTTEHML